MHYIYCKMVIQVYLKLANVLLSLPDMRGISLSNHCYKNHVGLLQVILTKVRGPH